MSHADGEEQVGAWLYEAKNAHWQTPQDIKKRYVSASILSDNEVVFNIKGNKYRLYTIVNYKNQMIIIKKIGTHAEYEKWNL